MPSLVYSPARTSLNECRCSNKHNLETELAPRNLLEEYHRVAECTTASSQVLQARMLLEKAF